jgi:ABC-2 type transport system permease protein
MKNFSGFAALLKKELIIYFAGPIFYITGFFFLLLTGYFFYANVLYYGITSLAAAVQATNPEVAAQLNPQNMVYQPLFMVLAIVLMFLVPLLTMRLLAEEKRSGTAELLFTYPLADWSIILGKFAAAFLIYLIFLAFTASYSLALCFMTRVDLGALAAGYLGVVLLGASFLSLGLFASSLTENQIIAGVVGFALLLLFWVIGWTQELGPGGALGRVMQFLSLTEHYENFSKGVINTRDLVYYASFIFFFLFLTKRQLESRRWRA